MYSTRSSGISVVAERFIRTLKNKHCKYMTSVSQNVYIDKLGNIVKKYSSTFHRSIKMNPVDIKSQINFSKENIYKDQKFKIADHVRLSKYKTFLAKGYVPKFCYLKKKKILHRNMKKCFIEDLNRKKLFEIFTKTIQKKQIKKNLGYKK